VKHRTLVRVVGLRPDGGVSVVIPGWSPCAIELRGLYAPPTDWDLKQGDRLHAKVNLDAKTLRELALDEWEPR